MNIAHSVLICIYLWSFGFNFPNITSDYTITVQSFQGQLGPWNTFHPDYDEDIQNAQNFLTTYQQAIQTISKADSELCRKTIAVVFPELIRYHRFRDFLETEALSLLYVRYGPHTADFSIGPFQMKPSFAEKLESRLSKLSCLPFDLETLLINEQISVQEQRRLRIERLSNVQWQLKYAQAFVWMMENFPPYTLPATNQEHLHFLATAYNYGFDRPLSEIKSWQKKAAFPYGLQFPIPQFPYADLSLYYYSQH